MSKSIIHILTRTLDRKTKDAVLQRYDFMVQGLRTLEPQSSLDAATSLVEINREKLAIYCALVAFHSTVLAPLLALTKGFNLGIPINTVKRGSLRIDSRKIQAISKSYEEFLNLILRVEMDRRLLRCMNWRDMNYLLSQIAEEDGEEDE